MYCDLNIPCSSNPDRASVDRIKLILSRVTQFQECTVALNYTMQGKMPLKSEKYNFDKSLLNSPFPLTVLSRVTIETDELLQPDTVAQLRENFDLIAIKTTDFGVFQQACTSVAIDIISFHFTERLPFEIKAADINKALKRHVYFELSYANAIRDAQARTYTIGVAKQLFEFTHGNNCIITSGAEIVSEIRNPADVFYFAKSLGLPNDKAKFTVEKNCEQLIHLVKNK
ncbi:hypothetical protein INT47_002032 [Mucor saturninus]|uniref:Uncharacterized protein n=1 Tax=Mucor saturninus TaxID=64648 RepID=A0A8H7V1A2_9FUNG|nr:hypothetical protein INT47_002032 [Mucor saturninus]